MASIEDMAGELAEDSVTAMDVRLVPIDRIRPNADNANHVDDETMETLRSDIRDNGFTQPVFLRPVDGDPDHDFELIDGEHRWRIVGELGGKVIPAVVREGVDDTDALLRLVTMNKLRGRFVPIRMARLMVRLQEEVGGAELKRRLGMDDAELRDHLRLAELGLGTTDEEVREKIRDAVQKEAAEAPAVLTFVLPKKEAGVAERVLARLTETDDKTDRAKALMRILREWEKLDKERDAA